MVMLTDFCSSGVLVVSSAGELVELDEPARVAPVGTSISDTIRANRIFVLANIFLVFSISVLSIKKRTDPEG
jgi:hypothetical protein